MASVPFRVYLDNCCWNRPFDDQAQVRVRLETEAKLEIQRRIKEGEIELAWSYILDYENQANPFEERREAIALEAHGNRRCRGNSVAAAVRRANSSVRYAAERRFASCQRDGRWL